MRGRGQDKRGRSGKAAPFLMLPFRVLDHPAWRALSPFARDAVIAIARKYRGPHDPLVEASVRHVVEITGQSHQRAQKSIREARDAGFLEAIEPGHMGVEGRGVGTRWLVSFQAVTGKGPSWAHEATPLPARNSEARDARYHTLCCETSQGAGAAGSKLGLGVMRGITREGPSLCCETSQSIDLPVSGTRAAGALRRFAIIRGGVAVRHGVRIMRNPLPSTETPAPCATIGGGA